MDSAGGGLVGTPIRPKYRREPSWAQSKNPSLNRLKKALKPGRRQPGQLEEQLALAAPEPQVVPRRKLTSPGYTLLRATGWKGHAAQPLNLPDDYNLANVLAATVQPRDSRGLGFDGAPPTTSLLEILTGVAHRARKPIVQRVVSDGPAVFDDGADETDEGGLDAAAARMQLALVTQRRANNAAPLATLRNDDTDRELFAEFADSKSEYAVAPNPAVQVFVNGEKVDIATLQEGCITTVDNVESCLPNELRAEAERFAAIEARRVQRTGLLIEGAVRKFENGRAKALEKTRALSLEILKDKFVSTGTTATEAVQKSERVAKRARKVDDVARENLPWTPDPLLCKRFGVPPPKAVTSGPTPRLKVAAKVPELLQSHSVEDDDDFTEFEIIAITHGEDPSLDFKSSSSVGNGVAASMPTSSKHASLQEPSSSLPLHKAIFEAPRNSNGKSTSEPHIRSVPNPSPKPEVLGAQGADASVEHSTRRKRKSRFRNAQPSNTLDNANKPSPRKKKILRAVDFF